MTRPTLFVALVALLTGVRSISPQSPSYNGLAVTPSMGWDNWNAFACDVSADLLLGTAKLIVKYGLRDLGYEYVILDDCWSDGRYANGTLKPDFAKFPNGMKAVGDALHNMGLKFGMYSSAGYLTCAKALAIANTTTVTMLGQQTHSFFVSSALPFFFQRPGYYRGSARGAFDNVHISGGMLGQLFKINAIFQVLKQKRD